MITKKTIANERKRHFIGETFKTLNKATTTERFRVITDVRVIGVYKHFLVVTNGIYNWCITYRELLVPEEET